MPKLQVGDLTIQYATNSEYLPSTGAYHWVGAKTEVEVPDKASKSILYVHADDIKASRVGKSEYGQITLAGNVRYRLVQKAEDGVHTLEGTAGHAEMRRTIKRLEMTGGVRATLTDAARFNGPATLRTGNLTVAMATTTYHYHLDGSAASNDIQFTPLQTSAAKAGAKAKAATPIGAVHIFGFRAGDLQFGQSVHLQGASTTCEFASPDEQTAWRLQGEQFEGEFVPNTSDFQRATVMENVKFHTSQPAADKKTKTILDGNAPQASYVRGETGQEMVVHGPFSANLTDPVHFTQPGTLSAGQSSVLSVKKSGDSLSYSLIDPNSTQQFRIYPKTLDVDEPKPASLTVPK